MSATTTAAAAAARAAETAFQVLRLPPLPTLKDILRLYKLRALKQLSQNFLLQEKTTNKIVKAAGKLKDCHVIEVGPGPGGITRSILQKGVKHLTVVEKDYRFKPCLEMLEDASANRMSIVYGDILKTNLGSPDIFPEVNQPETKQWEDDDLPSIHVIGNLPFSVSTPLIIHWLKNMSEKTGIFRYGRIPLTLTFQKEIAERMVADIMSRQRCRLSIMCQYLADVDHVFTIKGSAFVPKPDVDVGVVRFVPLVKPKIDQPFDLVEKVMRHVFHYRQKHCKKSIATLFPSHLTNLTAEMLKRSEIAPETRSYQLGIEEFSRLCDVYSDICERIPGMQSYEYRIPASVKQWEGKEVE